MDKLARFAAVMTALVLLAGCAGKRVQTTQEAQANGQTAQQTPPEFGIWLSYTKQDGLQPNEYINKSRAFASGEMKQVTLSIDDVDLAQLKKHIKPMSKAITIEEPVNISGHDSINVNIDVEKLKGKRTVTITKGLRSSFNNSELAEDLVLDFGATEWHVKLQRLDPVTAKEIAFAPNVVDTAVKVRLSFDTPADRASVEEAIQDGLFKHDGRLYKHDEPDFKPDFKADTTFGWESDISCVVDVKGLKYGYTYGINLMEAHAQDGTRILVDHTLNAFSTYYSYDSFPVFSETEEPWENFTYIFQCREPRHITALSLKDGSERMVQSLGDAFLSFGPVSPSGRYIAVKQNQFSIDNSIDNSRRNIVLFDRVSGTLLPDTAASAEYYDQIAVDDSGRLYTNWSRRDAGTGMVFVNPTPEMYFGTLQVKDESGSVVSTFKVTGNHLNFSWLHGGLIVYDWREVDTDTVWVVNTKGETVKTFAGYRLLSASPDGRLFAIVKEKMLEVYDTSWVKQGAIDLGKLGAPITNEGESYDIRELVRLFWSGEKVCIVYLKQVPNNYLPQACSWDYTTGDTLTVALPSTEIIGDFVPLYFDSDKEELLIVKDAWQMWSTYTLTD